LQEIIGLVSLLLPVFDSLRHLWIILCLQVSMFTKNYDHLPRDRYFGLYNEATRANPNYFLMVMWNRLQRFKNICIRVVLIDAMHRIPKVRYLNIENYLLKQMLPQQTTVCFCSTVYSYTSFLLCSETKLEKAAILHYTYTEFSDLTSMRDRFGCKPAKQMWSDVLSWNLTIWWTIFFFPLMYLHSVYVALFLWTTLSTSQLFFWLTRWNGTFISLMWYDANNEKGDNND
jgi:hypothetical protein